MVFDHYCKKYIIALTLLLFHVLQAVAFMSSYFSVQHAFRRASSLLGRQQQRLPVVRAPSITNSLFRLSNSSSSSTRLKSTIAAAEFMDNNNNNYSSNMNKYNHPQEQEQLMQDVLFRIRKINSELPSNTMDFVVDGTALGKVTPSNAQRLCQTSNNSNEVFQIIHDDNKNQNGPYLTLNPQLTSYEQRTEAVMYVMEKLRDEKVIAGWRDELFPVTPNFYECPLFAVERAAVPWLGCLEYGVHMNGIVNVDDNDSGQKRMWLARRSKTKSKYPGFLDHVVAGGQPVGISLFDNVIKECYEEAGIPAEITKQAMQPAGAISYQRYIPKKDVVERCVLFNYDLFLPADFTPTVVDGEVDEFMLVSIDDVMDMMTPNCSDPIKPNCYVVIIDFLMRHGYLSPDTKGYLDVLRELRGGDCK